MPEPHDRAEGVRRILVVDDDVALTQGLRCALENQGYVVRTMNRGSQVVETSVRFRPHLIVLDVMMPGTDGWEVLRRLRANPSTETTPVVMLTASDSDRAKITGLSLGADDYVTKPFSLQELRLRIAAVLRRSTAAPDSDDDSTMLPVVVAGDAGHELLRVRDVYYVEGIRNYTYVHTYDARFLSRLPLGAVDGKHYDGLMRVHRSFIVNLTHVKGCGWTTKSLYRLRLSDALETDIAVSRTLVTEVQRRLGLRS